MDTDAKLLREFAVAHDNAVFAEIVRRHINFVYSTALRRVNGDAHLASDVTQLVFIDLAKKCRQVASHPVLAGWLHTTTRYAAAQLIRTEQRRRRREQEAHVMIENDRSNDSADYGNELQSLLDDVLGRLKPHERDALMLRYIERRTYSEVGERLRMTESAARSCVDRAVDKLQGFLAQRGITTTAAALAVAFADLPATAAPAGLASTVTAAAVASAGAAGMAGTVLVMSKIQTVLVAALVAGIGTIAFEWNLNTKLRAQVEARGSTPTNTSTRSSAAATATSAGMTRAAVAAAAVDARSDAAELVLLRNRLAVLTNRPDGVVDSEIRVPQNVGRATPDTAAQTLMWAVQNHDVVTAASFFEFVDDTPQNREKFMANFSEAIRRRYPTPEQICAAGNFGIGAEAYYSPDDAMQILSVSQGQDSPGKMVVYAWYRHNGSEYGSESGFIPGRDGGWVMPIGLTNRGWINYVSSRLDPQTGDFIWRRPE